MLKFPAFALQTVVLPPEAPFLALEVPVRAFQVAILGLKGFVCLLKSLLERVEDALFTTE